MALLALLLPLGRVARYSLPFIRGDALYQATCSSDYAQMTRELEARADPNYLFDGSTPALEFAVQTQDAKATAIILHFGADRRLLTSQQERRLDDPACQRKISTAGKDLQARR